MSGPADFFVSYTSADSAWAEWIAQTLEDAGYQTIVQAWDFRPGQDFLHQMQQATMRADRTIAVLSPAYLGSAFGEAEWRAAFSSDPTGEQGLLLPVRVAEVTPPGLLRSRTYLDLVGLDEPAATARLLAGARLERAKPVGRRLYPGSQTTPSGARFPGRRPAIFEVPPRNPHFTGRNDLLQALRAHLAKNTTGAVERCADAVDVRRRPGTDSRPVPGPAGGHWLAAGTDGGQSRADERHPSQPVGDRVIALLSWSGCRWRMAISPDRDRGRRPPPPRLGSSRDTGSRLRRPPVGWRGCKVDPPLPAPRLRHGY
jgi:TIR domain